MCTEDARGELWLQCNRVTFVLPDAFVGLLKMCVRSVAVCDHSNKGRGFHFIVMHYNESSRRADHVVISSSSWCVDNCRFKIGCFTPLATQPVLYQYSLLENQFSSFSYECFWARKLNCYELLSTQFRPVYNDSSGPGNSVGIATDYGLDGPGSNPGGDEIFPPVHTGPEVHPASCKMGTGFSRG